MSIAEREANAITYIEKCARRRQRAACRRQKKINRVMRFATLLASGVCAIGLLTALAI